MPISNIGTAADYSQINDFRKVQVKAEQTRAAAVENLTASLPGREGRKNQTADLGVAASDITNVSQALNKKLKFVVNHRSNEVIVKVIDGNTDKVIKVIPPEELQRLHRKLKETIGYLFNERV